MYKWRLENVLSRLRALYRMETDRAKREFIRVTIEDQQMGIRAVEKDIQDAKMIGVRNPSFDGDMIGYPDDDFKD